MIVDSVAHWSLYAGLNKRFKKAFDYLISTDFNTLPLGKHAIDGDDLFVICMEYETKDPSVCLLENHKKYIDIQYMVSGEEFIGVTTFDNQMPSVLYDEATDIAFYKGDAETMVRMMLGQFAIFFPHDLHMPCVKTQSTLKVRKAVFKVSVD